MSPRYTLLGPLALLVPLSAILALLTGSSDTGIDELWSYMSGQANSFTTTIIALRAQRAIDGFIVGALLSMAGALLQVLLRNPLAEPYILGISGGGPYALSCAFAISERLHSVSIISGMGPFVYKESTDGKAMLIPKQIGPVRRLIALGLKTGATKNR